MNSTPVFSKVAPQAATPSKPKEDRGSRDYRPVIAPPVSENLGVRKTHKVIQTTFRFGGRDHNLPWYPRRGTRADLAVMFKGLGFNLGAEIGVQRGYFSEALCASNPNLHLFSIDPWAPSKYISEARQTGHYNNAVQRLSKYNVTIVRKPSLEAVKDFPDEHFDFVYIDGDHSFDAAIQDIIYWVPKVKIGGIVAAHDYHNQCGADVIKAVDAYTHCHGIYPWYVTREELPTAYWVKDAK